jgi:hypothetical protein
MAHRVSEFSGDNFPLPGSGAGVGMVSESHKEKNADLTLFCGACLYLAADVSVSCDDTHKYLAAITVFPAD